MSEELKSKGVCVVLLHPGFNRTDMTKKYAHIWDEEGAVPPAEGDRNNREGGVDREIDST